MKKFICAAFFIAACTSVICLVGCGSDTDNLKLDKTAATHGITYSVSSAWQEEIYDSSYNTRISGFISYSDDANTVTAIVSYSDSKKYETPEAGFNAQLDGWQNDEYIDFKYIQYLKLCDMELPNADCAAYEYSYESKIKSSNYDYMETNGCIAYIVTSNIHYEIEVIGQDCTSIMQAILKTISVEQED